MSVVESAFLFDCEGDELVGIIAAPPGEAASIGVLVVVGGPQYRVGSHRQFVLLARHLAANGVPCMRFDYRGMGDATGAARDFEAVDRDIRAAVDAFFERRPGLRRVVLWGLCDGASAACFYARYDKRLAGLVLLNPWVKTATGVARTYLKHYYLRRLGDPAFWRKLLSGRVAFARSVGEWIGTVRSARGLPASGPGEEASLPSRMGGSLAASALPFAVLLSERDYVAREFEDAVRHSERWQCILSDHVHVGTTRLDTDHTFSSAKARDEVATATLGCVLAFGRLDGVSE